VDFCGRRRVGRHCRPILRFAGDERVNLRRVEDRERLAEGLRKAGLPE
jgi:hypothetical protein